MHSYSRTWVSPRYKENGQRLALNHARRKLCPNSPFWTNNFDLAKHKKEWEEGQARRIAAKEAQDKKTEEERKKLHGSSFPLPTITHAPFNGKDFTTNHSAVLLEETIFVPTWEKGKENIAPWPSKSEMKYEGDDRISTDRLHRRFLGAPRIEGNDTVNWQHRAIIEQFALDDFYYPGPTAVDVWLRTHRVEELEFTDEVGVEVLGRELFGLLDPVDQW